MNFPQPPVDYDDVLERSPYPPRVCPKCGAWMHLKLPEAGRIGYWLCPMCKYWETRKEET